MSAAMYEEALDRSVTGSESGDTVCVERRGAVALLRFNRPERLNALDLDTSRRCRAFFRAAADDDEIRVVVVTGTGERAFCAGFDVKTVPEGAFERWDVSVGGLTKDIHFPKPVIAAVNGLAFGGGFEVMLACDLRLAVPSARFAFPEVRLGLMAGGGGTVRLPDNLPWAIAAEMLLRGRVLEADEALRFGLVNAIVPPEELLDAAWGWADEIAAFSPPALHATKESMRRAHGISIDDALQFEEGFSRLLQMSDDARRTVEAFLAR